MSTGELPTEGRKALGREMILVVTHGDVDGTLYAHDEFLGAFQAALLDRIEHSMVPTMTGRRAAQALARLRSPDAYRATLTDALRRLKKNGTPIDPSSAGDRRVVAVFPLNA